MEAATLAGLAGNATGPPSRFAASPQSRMPASHPGPVSAVEGAAGVDAQVPSAMPYAQRLRREGAAISSMSASLCHTLHTSCLRCIAACGCTSKDPVR